MHISSIFSVQKIYKKLTDNLCEICVLMSTIISVEKSSIFGQMPLIPWKKLSWIFTCVSQYGRITTWMKKIVSGLACNSKIRSKTDICVITKWKILRLFGIAAVCPFISLAFGLTSAHFIILCIFFCSIIKQMKLLPEIIQNQIS